MSGSVAADELITVDLASGAITTYFAPNPYSSDYTIYGFEYLKSQNILCMTYDEGFGYITPGAGGYAAAVTAPAVTAVAANYAQSDMELDKNGDLLLVYNDLGGNSSLAYLPSSALTSAFTSTAPTLMPGSCQISLNNQANLFTGGVSVLFTYLGTQIRNENCLSGMVSITSPSVTCGGGAPTFTATGANLNCAVFSWYKSLGGTNPYTDIANCVGCNSITDDYATNGEEVYCTVTVPNTSFDYCTSGSALYSNTVTVRYANLQIANVDINTLCLPENGTAPNPVYTVTATGGSGIYSYNWDGTFYTDNNATLSRTDISNPQVNLVSNPYFGDFNLTVSDGTCSVTREVTTQFNSYQSYDLASRDSYFDMYDEPNSQQSYNLSYSSFWSSSQNICSSPDIVNRLHSDGIFSEEEPIYSPTHSNYLYIKVRNVGCYDYTGASVLGYTYPSLDIYWTIGGIGGAERWDGTGGPNAWTNETLPAVPSGIVPKGLCVASVTIPTITAGAYAIIGPITYTPPNPQQYTAACNVGVTGSPNEMDLCFLSRIADYHNGTTRSISYGTPVDEYYGMTYIEGPDPDNNALRNNNIVTLNTSVMYFTNAAYPTNRVSDHYLYVGNLTATEQTYSIQFANYKPDIPSLPARSTLSNFIYIKVYLGSLFDLWQDGGALGNYTTVDYTEKSVTFDGSHTVQLDGITMPSDSTFMIHLACYKIPGMNMSAMQPEIISFSELASPTGPFLGSYTYKVKYSSSHVSPQGVLALAEISQGPGNNAGCEYAEMVVGNCGSDASLNVDVSGWIIDDNDGNFDTGSCPATGITPGHYRLAYNNIWQNIQVGSRIIVYNQANNCYGLPDTFTMDTVNNIYWVPIFASQPDSYLVERYFGTENGSDTTSYCSDTGTTVYTPAYGWEQTIALAPADAIQVRCPGCTAAFPGKPPFYHGIGYSPDDSYCYESIAPGADNLGGPVVINPYSNQKYVFTGTTTADLGDPTQWTAYNADPAGVPPATLGYVDSALYYGAFLHVLGLPCCGYGDGDGSRRNNPAATHPGIPQSVTVYPNPANTTLYFAFPLSANIQIKLTDITGRTMNEQVLHNATTAGFNVANYTPGVYLYQVTTDNQTQSGKVVIE